MQFYNGYNSYFYYVNGNDCTNFVSQCVAYGFGNTTSYTSASSYRMYNNGNATTGWFAGSGGGSSPWESVNAHWTYMRSAKTNTDGPRTSQLSQSSVGLGDVMQIDFDNDGDYDHSVICVNTSPLRFAQHTSGTIKSINDYEGVKRFYRPTSYRMY